MGIKPEGVSFVFPHGGEIRREAKVGTGSGGIRLPDEGDRKVMPDNGD